MHCDGCTHWGGSEDPEEWESKGVGFRKCNAVRPRWKIQDEAARRGIRRSPQEQGIVTKARNDALIAARAYVQDGSEYVAELYTGPDFFCALHETKREFSP